ncbi:AzlD domain-containing protein [Chitinibacter bivalviorum]|uniref:AzlD domain-containing protein n=1 Tax=Chitinibacter bivalviorum TaxID=2739434 RepID=A0A7H9BH45_9NEIS|nr:AzlD domain-containing protein [Chitinibacter bivalviorum]QLG87271.1 AzlD domain-containing protein [Chitinibacter bivalviorum]
MDIPNLILMLAGMALVTYGVRVVFFLPGVGDRLPPRLRQAMAYVPVAVLTAIIVPEVFIAQGQLNAQWQNPALWGMLATACVMWKSKRLLLAIGVGMMVYFALRSLFGY